MCGRKWGTRGDNGNIENELLTSLAVPTNFFDVTIYSMSSFSMLPVTCKIVIAVREKKCIATIDTFNHIPTLQYRKHSRVVAELVSIDWVSDSNQCEGHILTKK